MSKQIPIIPLLNFFLIMLSLKIQAQELPIRILEEGHIVVPLKVNDSISANFILDTGAGVTVMSSKFFSKISSSTKEMGYFTGFRHDGDRLDGELYSIQSIELGGYVQKDIVGAIYPPLDDYGIEGLLSMTFFRNKAFSIDYKNQKLVLLNDDQLEKVAEQFTSVPISLYQKGGVSLDFSIPICVNNEIVVNAEFDTGSGYHTILINPYFMQKLNLDSTKLTSSVYTTPVEGNELTDYISQQEISVCNSGLERQSKTVLFREKLIYEALIGSGLFADKRITIDIPGKRFFIEE